MAPTPKPNPVRRNARIGPLLLPASGRKEPAPDWPLPCKLSTHERRIWDELWGTPQAVAWENMGWIRIIARYCLLVAKAELHEAPVPLMAEVRQIEDRLGLTPKSMRMLLWEIAPDEVAIKRGEVEEREEASKQVRKRLKAVDAG